VAYVACHRIAYYAHYVCFEYRRVAGKVRFDYAFVSIGYGVFWRRPVPGYAMYDVEVCRYVDEMPGFCGRQSAFAFCKPDCGLF
jgi:hypothetical protein